MSRTSGSLKIGKGTEIKHSTKKKKKESKKECVNVTQLDIEII
jgi:hypothetical protein